MNCEYINKFKDCPCSELKYKVKKCDLDGLEKIVCSNHIWLVSTDQKNMYGIVESILRKERTQKKFYISLVTLGLMGLAYLIAASLYVIIVLVFIAFIFFIVFDP